MSNLHYNWAGGTSLLGAVKSLLRGQAILVSLGAFTQNHLKP